MKKLSQCLAVPYFKVLHIEFRLFLLIKILFFKLTLFAQNPIQFNCATKEIFSPDLPIESLEIGTNYLDCSDLKYVRVAVHYMLREHKEQFQVIDNCSAKVGSPPTYPISYISTWGNFTPYDDGIGGNYNGYKRAKDLIYAANYELANNAEPWLKVAGQDYPRPAPENKVRYVLAGVYFHYNNEEYDLANFSELKAVHHKYDVDTDNIYDVYVFNNYLNGSGVASSIGNSYQYAGDNKYCAIAGYREYLKVGCRDWSLNYQASTFNHEAGHSFGLYHSWGIDDLADTKSGEKYSSNYPVCDNKLFYANCWKHEDFIPTGKCSDYPCVHWEYLSNNLMDYNGWFPHALTVQQITKVHNNLISIDGNPYLHDCSPFMPAISFFEVKAQYNVCPALNFYPKIHINPKGTFNEDEYKISICELDIDEQCVSSFTTGWVRSTISNNSTFNLSNLFNFKANKKYKITLDVKNRFNQKVSSMSRNIETLGCPNGQNSNENAISLTSISPFSSELLGSYLVNFDGNLQVVLLNNITAATMILETDHFTTQGLYSFDYDTSGLSDGIYTLVIIFEGYPFYRTIIKETN
ncbi:MAG: reprolysin-like metallopeptidase [Saprospiraceae bacterium]